MQKKAGEVRIGDVLLLRRSVLSSAKESYTVHDIRNEKHGYVRIEFVDGSSRLMFANVNVEVQD